MLKIGDYLLDKDGNRYNVARTAGTNTYEIVLVESGKQFLERQLLASQDVGKPKRSQVVGTYWNDVLGRSDVNPDNIAKATQWLKTLFNDESKKEHDDKTDKEDDGRFW